MDVTFSHSASACLLQLTHFVPASGFACRVCEHSAVVRFSLLALQLHLFPGRSVRRAADVSCGYCWRGQGAAARWRGRRA